MRRNGGIVRSSGQSGGSVLTTLPFLEVDLRLRAPGGAVCWLHSAGFGHTGLLLRGNKGGAISVPSIGCCRDERRLRTGIARSFRTEVDRRAVMLGEKGAPVYEAGTVATCSGVP